MCIYRTWKNKHTCALRRPKLILRSQRRRGWSVAELEPATERRAKLCRRVASALLTLRQAAAFRIEAPFPTVRGPRSSLLPKRRLQTRPRATCLGTTALRPRGLLRRPSCRQTNRSYVGAKKSGLLHLRAGGPIFVPSTVSYHGAVQSSLV